MAAIQEVGVFERQGAEEEEDQLKGWLEGQEIF
jgi:hypothetical protein